MKDESKNIIRTLDSSAARSEIKTGALVDSVQLPDGFTWPSLKGFHGSMISSEKMRIKKPWFGSRTWLDCILQNCNFDGLRWWDLHAHNCEFSNTNFGHRWMAFVNRSTFDTVTFKSCEFIGTIFENVSFRNVVFEKCLLKRVQFHNCKFDQCKFSGKLAIVNFIDCEIKNCDFRDAFCGGVSFPKTTINDTLFPDHKRNFWISSGDLRKLNSAAIQLSSEASRDAVISFFKDYTQWSNGILIDDSHMQRVAAEDRRKIIEYLYANR